MRLNIAGYSGVVIYTKNSTCAPIKAEEGITGILTPPNSSTSFRDLPDDEQIGGYPNAEQLSQSEFDAATLDSEGRCVILEFPAFVLIGTYCPAERDETRTHFRTGFLQVLDSRIRNLAALGKRVIWTGDLNISREEIDTAMAEEMMRKNGVDSIGWISTPARRLFNQLLVGGRVHGERDEGRESQVMWDVCRAFHPSRKGMYTCWETKVNARPGNYGARIDYVVCSHDMQDWFADSNIQEGLMGSDHCPVYAVIKDQVIVDGKAQHILDLVNPPSMFREGVRQKEWTMKNLLPMSGKLIQEFDRRRSIRDMFSKKPSLLQTSSTMDSNEEEPSNVLPTLTSFSIAPATSPVSSAFVTALTSPVKAIPASQSTTKPINGKRGIKSDIPAPPAKRTKSSSQSVSSSATLKGQQSLKGFFMSKSTPTNSCDTPAASVVRTPAEEPTTAETMDGTSESVAPPPAKSELSVEDQAASFASKQTWGKLFAKPIAPKCEHDEPCKTMLTKKPGVNCGRSFWMCNRPLGPSGKQERNTQWRCNTFIWASDWDGHAGEPP